MTAMAGTVYLVGAGPGDPELLSLKARRLLGAADVVVHDRLIDQRTLAMANSGAELVDVGKTSGDSAAGRQDGINRLLIDLARAGKDIVRLKGGDPFLFGRGGEEGAALSAAGIRFEVVPAPTSAIAAPAYAGIPVTHRGLASAVTFITGNEDPDKVESAVNWEAAAASGGTIVVLMGRDNLRSITGRLISAGMDLSTPAALVRWGSKPSQETIVGTVYDIAARADDAELPPPVALVIGKVVELRAELNWFETLPLFGKRVLVTRTRSQAGALSSRLSHLGAMPLEVPSLALQPIASEVLSNAIRHLSEYAWVVFTSANAANVFFEQLGVAGMDARAFGGARIAAIGPATAASLARFGIRPDAVPDVYLSSELPQLLARHGLGDGRILLPRSSSGTPRLVSELSSLGAKVDDVPIYRVTVPDGSAELAMRHLADGVDIATFTSSSTVTGLMRLIGGAGVLCNVTVACIGPITAAAAREAGLTVDIVASEHTVDGLVNSLSAHYAPGL